MRLHNSFNMMRKECGYTLIEILIVLLIISIVTSVGLLSISHNKNKQVETFANEVTQLITLAEEQAMLEPNVLGLSFDENAFYFSSLQSVVTEEGAKKNRWIPVTDSILSQHSIPNNLQVDLRLAGSQQKKTSSDAEDDEDKDKQIQPQIIFSTNGDITPFVIYVGKKDGNPSYIISGNADGSVTSKLLS